jgi:hypothetical protein
VTLPKNLITTPCRIVAVVVSEIPLPPSPVHGEVEGRRSAAASGQNSERVGDEVYVYSVSQATFINQAETDYLIAVKLSPLSSRN